MSRAEHQLFPWVDALIEATLALVSSGLLGYQLLVVWYVPQGALEFYYTHLGGILLVMALCVATRHRGATRLRRAARQALLGACALAAVVAAVYFALNGPELELRQPFINRVDFLAGVLIIAPVLVLSWIVWGKVLSTLMALAIVYFAYGDLISGRFGHSAFDGDTIMSYLAGMGGARGVLWGVPLSANTLFLIIVYGGLLKGTRVLEMFNEIGKSLVVLTRAGVCYSAVIASSLIGMVTGQAVANIALSGAMTIPSMKQRGATSEQAGAIEVLASLGSQLLPPIMGLGAFLMAVTLGVPYVDIATAAIIPAFLYVSTIVIGIHFLVSASPHIERAREDIDLALLVWMLPSFLVSFLALVVLLYMRFSPALAAFWAIMLLVALSYLRPRRFRPRLREIWQGTRYGVESACQLALILAGLGLIVQVLVTTGAGFDLGRGMMGLAQGNIGIALFMAMVLALVVGMGLPTPAAYALLAIIMIPFLVDLGVQPLVAHFFGFYFAIFSALTPPVAVGIMTATRISSGRFYGTFLETGKLAIVCFLIPYSFAAFPSLLEFPALSPRMLMVCTTLLLTTVVWAAMVYGIFVVKLSVTVRCALVAAPAGYFTMLVTQNLWWALVPAGTLLVLLAATFPLRRIASGDQGEAGAGRSLRVSLGEEH